jgi:pilus assembly protein CpaF
MTDAASSIDQRWAALKQALHRRLIQGVDHTALRTMDEASLRYELRLGAEELCRNHPDLLSLDERTRLIHELIDETLGLGPLERLLKDPNISDILINGPQSIYVERHGRLELTPITFSDDEHLLATVQKIVGRVGRRVDESSPMVDARLPDGSRVNAIIPPLAIDGALVSIRRFRTGQVTAETLLSSGSINRPMLAFLAACVQASVNLLVSGGTGSGKTTLLNLLSQFIPHGERIVSIEDAAELRLSQPHVARLETRPANLEGAGAITARDLLRNALRMRPDRIIVGECRGAEAFDMLQAMNTGHSGSMTTLHANSTHDAVFRLQMLVGMAGLDLPMWHIDRQIAAGLQIMVQVARLPGGERRVTQISELAGIEEGQIVIRDLFAFEQSGTDEQGRSIGQFVATGQLPEVLQKIHARGIDLDRALFQRSLDR